MSLYTVSMVAWLGYDQTQKALDVTGPLMSSPQLGVPIEMMYMGVPIPSLPVM
jgi:hypothetical protein